MNVLSLFDGMSCGMIALERAGIKVGAYYSSEIDKYAQVVSEANYPQIVRVGDVTKWREWDIDWSSIDLLIGGSPCQGFSFAGKQLAFSDPRSALFFEYLNILNHIKSVNPKVKFFLENVKMKKEYLNVISGLLGVEPVFINSSLVSAQNRQRYYWANWEFGQPEDKGIMLADILECDYVDRDKSHCLDANYYKGENLKSYFEKNRRQLAFTNPASIVGRRLNEKGVRDDYNKNTPITQCLQVKHNASKMQCLTTVQKDTVISLLPPGRYPILDKSKTIRVGGVSSPLDSRLNWTNVIDSKEYYRKLTPIECERLQTVPDNFTAHVSNTQRYKMLGNGWTVDVIAHIFRCMKTKAAN